MKDEIPAVCRRVALRMLKLSLPYLSLMLWMTAGSVPAFASCSAPANPIEAENCLTGSPSTEWDVGINGDDPTLVGFATDLSVNQGQTINFKIKSSARSYTMDIYRTGYYGGNGARKVASITPSVSLPQTQPACQTDASTNLVDCGNWAISASWQVPSNATSGIYFVHLVRPDTGGDNHIVFIVRNDASHSDMLFQTSDLTWQAYNDWGPGTGGSGGHSLYGPSGAFDLNNRAFKVSYNRPFHTRDFADESLSFVFGPEYAMVRWLERNGYDVSYFTGVDAARNGNLILNHKAYVTVGHDEYWSGPQRASVEAARAAGVNLAFFSGNEVFWKTRWENSIDGSNTPYRTLVCYKETLDHAKTDPDPQTWTGTWRDPTFSPPADGGRPENNLTGTIFKVNGPGSDNTNLSIQVPAADGKMRFWRNTSVANLSSGQTATLPAGTLGYEWDVDLDNGVRPPGLILMSTSTHNLTEDYLLDYGATYGAGTATHHLTLYRATSGALVFGAGTVQWSFALDTNHDDPLQANTPTDSRMQQATVNLFADLGARPATLQTGLVAASASTDATAPSSTITSPSGGSTIQSSTVSISGTATDIGGGVVGGVEVSVDGGTTWHPANGRENWTYSWQPGQNGSFTIRSRAVDDSGNLELPSTGISVSVAGANCSAGNSFWGCSAFPGTADAGPDSPVELGVKFRSDTSGSISGIRYYKSAGNTGTHVGNLWTSTGVLLASATFSGESSSGWQQVNFSSPVSITAGTTYVASYHTNVGHYSVDPNYFGTHGVDSPPLHALANGVDGPNGVFIYTSSSVFPTDTFSSSNYWVDVVFTTGSGTGTTPTVSSVSPASGASGVSLNTNVTVRFSQAMNPATINTTTVQLIAPSSSGESSFIVPATVTYNSSTLTATLTPTQPLTGSTNYTGNVQGGSGGATDINGIPMTANFTWSFTTSGGAGICPCSIWSSSAAPGTPDGGDNASVEVGVKFRSDVSGSITGIRFYKTTENTGTHVGSLWSSSGTLLASATFTAETASGWQQVSFSTPVAISANTTYLASYHTNVGHYSADQNFFATQGVDNTPLHALANGVDGPDGVFSYGSTSIFPNSTFNSTNYWVDVVFTNTGSGGTPPTVTAVSPLAGATAVSAGTSVTATFSQSMDPTTINANTFQLLDSSNSPALASVTYNSTSLTATLTPSAPLAFSNTYRAIVRGGATEPTVKNLSGTALAADFTWSFTTWSGLCPCSIWSNSSIPVTADAQPDNPVELGVKFRSEASGFITGVRFYKGSGNTGTHIGSLWSSSGTLLASATFTAEAASGWQQVSFSTPVAISANTTYVASYHTDVGHYSADQNFFATQGVDNTPLHALANGVDGPDGVFSYGSTSVFPNSSFSSTNYWVDVVFTTGTVTLSPPSLTFTSQQINTTSSAQTVTLSNTSSVALTISSVAIAGDFAQTNDCGASLGAGSSCTISVTFTPTAAGSRNGALTVNDSDASSPQTVSLTGTGASAATVTLSPTAVAFGNQPVSTTSASQAVTLTNSSSSSLTITSIGVAGTNPGDFAQTNNCPSTVAANGTCTINITFTPTAAGARAATLSVADNATGSPQTAGLSGTGTTPGVSLSPTSLAFASRLVGTTSAAQAVTLTNNGGAPLTIASMGIAGTNPGDFAQTNNCPLSPSTLAPAGSCTISVTFTPTATGARTAALTVSDNALGSPQTVSLTGTGTASAVSLSPTSLTFSTRRIGTTSSAQTVTLRDTGTATLSISSITITGGNSGDFTRTTTCGATLAAGSSCTISVRFTPTAAGTRSATLAVSDNAAGSPHTVSLTGTGTAVSLSTSSLSFGKQNIGTTSSPKTITMSNAGSAPLAVNGITITGVNAGDFSQTNTCGTSVAGGASCIISVTFRPTARNSRTATLTISDVDPTSPQQVSLSGQGR